jgi:hypothetical protein
VWSTPKHMTFEKDRTPLVGDLWFLYRVPFLWCNACPG